MLVINVSASRRRTAAESWSWHVAVVWHERRYQLRVTWFARSDIGLRVGNCNLRMNWNENSKGMSHNRSELNWNVNTDKNCFCESACKFKKTNHTGRKRHALPVPLVGDESWRATDSGLTMLQEWVGYIYIYIFANISIYAFISICLSIYLSIFTYRISF